MVEIVWLSGFIEDNFLFGSLEGYKLSDSKRYFSFIPSSKEKSSRAVGITPVPREDLYSKKSNLTITLTSDLHNFFCSSQWSECVKILTRIFPRVFFNSKNSREIEKFAIRVVAKIIEVTGSSGSVTAIFSSTPHLPIEVVLYYFICFKNGQVYVYRRTDFVGAMLVERHGRNGFINYENPPNELRADFYRLASDSMGRDSAYIQYSKNINAKIVNKTGAGIFGRTSRIYLRAFVAFLRCIIYFPDRWYTRLSAMNRLMLAYRSICRNIKLLSILDRVCEKRPRLDLPYVYVALQFQPERTTDPEIDIYTHIYLIISRIRALLPLGMQIYVKEHPRQYDDFLNLRRFHYRDSADYKDLLTIPNVTMLETEFDSSALIESAALTVTGTGSAAWEAVLQGKPSLTLGRTWHSLCPASPELTEGNSNLPFLEKLMSKTKAQVDEDRERFLRDKNFPVYACINGGAGILHGEPVLTEMRQNARRLLKQLGA